MNGTDKAKELCPKGSFDVAIEQWISTSDLLLEGWLLVQPWRYMMCYKRNAHGNVESTYLTLCEVEERQHVWHVGAGDKTERANFQAYKLKSCNLGLHHLLPTIRVAAILVAE